MESLKAALNMTDLELLLEAVGEWESVGNYEFSVMQQIKNIPVPDEEENEEAHKYIMAVKEHFKKREKEIKAARSVRQEQSTFLRAKLFMIKQKTGMDKLWTNPDDADISAPRERAVSSTASRKAEDPLWETKFGIAQAYMEEMKMWKYFETHMQEKLAALAETANDAANKSDTEDEE